MVYYYNLKNYHQVIKLKKILFLFSVLIITFCFSGCAQNPVSQTAFLLDTISTITVYEYSGDESAEEVINQCFELCSDYEKKLSRTIESSEISAVSSALGSKTQISNETAALISKAVKYSELSNGKFDITIAPVSSLWDFKSESPAPPNDEEIKEALTHVNYKNISVQGSTVQLLDEKAAIDLGGIAKGYIGDKSKEFLIEKGVKKALINLGGNILVICPENDSLKIGIQDPNSQEGNIIGAVSTNGNSLVTSGIYQRCFEYNGKTYHHILDTSTGYPADNSLASVTVIGPESADCDALSTTVFCLGSEEGLKLINSIDGYEAILVTKDSETIFSEGINKTIEYRSADELN